MSLPRIAVVGAGHLGSIHARLLKPRTDLELVAVVDPQAAARDRISTELDVPTFDSLDQIDSPLDAAIVAAPTNRHTELATRLLEQDVHLFVEKPLTPTSREARQLCDLAREKRRVLQVGHSERFNGAWLAALPCLGNVRRIRAVRQSGFPSRSLDVGVVFDLMIHEIDLVLSLTSAPIVQLSAHAATVVGPHEDIVSARIEFADGVVAELESSRVSPRRERKWDVVTRHGLLNIDFAEGATQSAFATSQFAAIAGRVASWPFDRRCRFAGELFEKWLPQVELDVTPVNALVAEHDELIQAIAGDGAVTVNGHAGARAVEVAERILAAAGKPERISPPHWPNAAEAA